MAKISRDLGALVGQPLHPRENLGATGTLGSALATVITSCDGCSTVSVDLRGTFSITAQVEGTVNGTDWILIPVRPQTGGVFVRAIVGTVAGVWMGSCAGFTNVRVLDATHTSGAATATIVASTALFDDFARYGSVTPVVATVTAAAGVAATLTIAAPGLGLRHYLTYLRITRFAAVGPLTAAATPVLVTTTNIPGTLVFSMPADAAALGTVFVYQEDFAYPIATTAQNTATTIVGPVTTGVIWRITAGYYVAP